MKQTAVCVVTRLLVQATFIFLLFVFSLYTPSYASTVIRWGDVLPPGSPSVAAMEKVSDEVAKKTGGRIRIQVFPSGQLGSSREMIESLTLGFQQMVTEGAANLGQWDSSLSILEAPYLWRDLGHMEKVMDGAIGKDFKKRLIENNGLRILGFFYNGVRHITTNRIPVKSVSDMKGFKLRVPENEVFLAMAGAWGAKPTPMNFSELYLALRQNLVDGQENPLPTIDNSKFYEVQKYLILTGHIMTPRLIVVSEPFWQTIPEEDRRIIEEAVRNGIRYNNREILDRERALIEKFKIAGMTIIRPDIDGFKDAVLKELPGRFEKKWGAGMFKKILESR